MLLIPSEALLSSRYMMKILSFLACVALGTWATPLLAQNKPVPVAESSGKFTLPKGFSATLFAGEPDIVQPIAFTFDDRGRVWLVECLSYPKWRADGKGSDRVTLLEDTDGDGRFDKKQVVYDQGSNLSGIELGFGGIWLCSSPNLVFLPCDFNADTPKVGAPQIVLDGWNMKDTKHNVFNALLWGPDGWLYGCNGIQSRSFVAKPGTPADKRTEFNCGVWRYHPTRQIFEPVAHGTTNPWGLDYDEYGEMFITNCVIKHLFHVVPGGHMDRMYGQDANPNSYGLIGSIADYIHWAGGDWTTSRTGKEHSDAGGGHAHSGAMIYLGDNLPPEYRNALMTCNIHGNRLNQDKLVRNGSGYKSERAPDFLFANDPWFRGITLKYGPDGGVYVADWSDTGECHNYDVADTSNGRLHKVIYGTSNKWKGNLAALDEAALVEMLKHPNDWFVRHARRLLQEKYSAKPADEATVQKLTALFPTLTNPVHRLRLAWLLHVIGDPTVGNRLLAQADNPPAVKAWGIRLLFEGAADELNRSGKLPTWASALADAKSYSTPAERLALASGLSRVKGEQRAQLASLLLEVTPASDATDHNLPWMVWYTIEPRVGNSAEGSMALLKQAQIPLVREYASRKWTAKNSGNLAPLFEVAAKGDAAIQRDILQGIQDGLGGIREMATPRGWSDVNQKLLTSSDPKVREKAMILAVTFGDQTAIDGMKKTVLNSKAELTNRATALQVLQRRGKPDLLPILKELVQQPTLRAEAIRGLSAFSDTEIPATLLKLYASLSEAEKEDAVLTLASRKEWASQLLDSIEKGSIPRRDVSPFVARQIQGLKDKKLAERLGNVWGQLQPASAQRTTLTKKYRDLLTQSKPADLSQGRAVFVRNCAACHKLYDDGGDIGPALTGSQRSNLDYILENVLDPSAIVPREYQVNVFELQSGRTINAIVRAETEKALTLRTANETLLVPKNEIDSRTVSKFSMMPEGIFEKLTEEEVRNLIAYLQGKQQVPLPK